MPNQTPIFSRADILLPNADPNANIDLTSYAVIACDQYTSEPDYWERVSAFTAEKFSTLSMVYPEIYLKNADFLNRIKKINSSMKNALTNNLFKEYKNSFFYCERKLKNGKIRHGIIGKIDLEEYDFSVSSKSHVRATEGTVLERIPPRVLIRQDAMLELPHVMLLLDDLNYKIIEPLSQQTHEMETVYDFSLMEQSGAIKGYRLSDEQAQNIDLLLAKFAENKSLSYAVGDGNHSLATAKQCYLNLKGQIGEKALESPARYALCELVNLHDSSLEFEAIHRILLNVEADDVILALSKKYEISDTFKENSPNCPNCQRIELAVKGIKKEIFILNPPHTLAVGTLQIFLDEYMKNHENCEIDFIHGEDVLLNLSKQEHSIGFLLPCMDKNDLFEAVNANGTLPRKTFSMGEACDKRFYLEARKIG